MLQPRRGAGVLVLRGEHDLASKEQLPEALNSLLETNQLVVADLSDVLYIRERRSWGAESLHCHLEFGTFLALSSSA